MRNLFIFLFCQILFSNFVFSQIKIENVEEKNFLKFKILESEMIVGKFISKNADSLGFSVYNGKELPSKFSAKNRMLTLRGGFILQNIDSNENLMLVFPPIFHSCNIYLNGNLIGKRGEIEKSYTTRIHYTETYFLSPKLLNFNGLNEISIEILSRYGENYSVNGIFISNRENADAHKAWRNFFSISFLRGMSLTSLIIFLYFFIFYFARKHQRASYYLPFSIVCFLYSFVYLSNIASYDFTNTFLVEKISRTLLILWVFFTNFYLLEYTKITKFKNKILIALSFPTFIYISLMFLQKNIFEMFNFCNKFVFPYLFLNLFVFLSICLTYFLKKRSKTSFILLSTYVLTFSASIYDLYFAVILQAKPFVLLIPYSFFLIIVVFFFIVAWEQNDIYKISLKKLEKMVEERTQELSQQKIEYQLLFENMINGFAYHKIITDSDGNPVDYEFIKVNSEFERLTGLKSSEIIGKRVLEVLPQTEKIWIEKYGKVALTGESTEFSNFSEAFEKYYFVSAFCPQKNYFCVIFNDVSELIIAQKNLKINNQRLELLFGLSQMKNIDMQIIFEKSLDIALLMTKSRYGYIYFYDEKTQQFTLNSWSKDVMESCKILNPQTIYDLEKTGIWGEAVRQRRPILVNDFLAENPLKKGYPAGHVELFRYLTIPIFNGNEIVAVIGVANKSENYDETDIIQLNLLADSVFSISQQKEDERKIHKYTEKLQKLNATKDKFFSIIAHDLKNPFNSILGFSELLTNYAESFDSEKIIQFANAIQSSALKTYKLLENLLEWARTQTGTIEFSPEKMFIKDIFNEIKEQVEDLSTSKNISLSFETDEYSEIFADKNMLNAVLRNLITNAIKYTPKNGKIFVKSLCETKYVKISVIDTGIGIDEKHLKKLFKINEKVSTNGTDEETGTGLGLLLCKKFISRHKGEIWVESKVNEGSNFSFSIPNSKESFTF